MTLESTTEAPEVAPEIASELRPGETVQWTGRPRRRSLLADLVPKSLIGVAVAALGWHLLQHPTTPLRLRGGGYAAVPWGVASLITLLGFHLAVTRVWFVRRRRGRMFYALTNLRAIIAERGGRWVAFYFLNAALEPRLPGGGAIQFGELSGPGRDQLSFPSSVPGPLRAFQLLDDAGHLLTLIKGLAASHREYAAARGEEFAPFARRIDPENQSSDPTIQRPPGEPLAYAEPVRAKLKKGEVTLFVGRPPQGVLFRRMDWFVIPFGLIWMAFACRSAYQGLRTGCPAVIALPFVAIGLYLLVGRYLHDAHVRSKTWYAVTNRRCLIVTDGEIIETKSLYWNFIQGVARQRHGDGSTTIHFELSALGRQDTPSDTAIGGLYRPPGIYFERLANAEGVEAIILGNVLPARTNGVD